MFPAVRYGDGAMLRPCTQDLFSDLVTFDDGFHGLGERQGTIVSGEAQVAEAAAAPAAVNLISMTNHSLDLRPCLAGLSK